MRFRSSLVQCIKTVISWRFFTVLCFFIVLGNDFSDMMRFYIAGTNNKVTSWLLPVALSNRYMLLLFMWSVVFLFSDIPHIDRQHQYTIIRIGYHRWIQSQFLTIALLSILLVFIFWGALLICLGDCVSFSLEWGTVLSNPAVPYDASGEGMYIVATTYNPIEATLMTVAYSVLVCMFLGTLITAFNIFYHYSIGVLVSSAFALLDYFIFLFLNDSALALWVSPISWANIAIFVDSRLINNTYAAIMLTVLIIGINIAICVSTNSENTIENITT